MESKYREGQFVWRELMTSGAGKARAFYSELFGWAVQEVPMPSGTYVLFKNDGREIAGMMQLSPDAGHPSAWLSYCSVPDVDKAVAAAEKSGGKVVMPAESMPGIGRFAIVTDSTGAAFGLLRGETGDSPAPSPPPMHTFCWETLGTTDVEKAKAFYTAVAGWRIEAAGPTAIAKAGETMVGDIDKAPPGVPPHWMPHVVVEKLEASRERAEKLGARVLVPSVDVPGYGRMSVIADPTGAGLSLFEPAMRSAS